MEKNKCDCSQCENWNECEIGLILHNPWGVEIDILATKTVALNIELMKLKVPEDEIKSGMKELIDTSGVTRAFKISKGDKVAQAMLMEHKSLLFGIETSKLRSGGFGSSGS